MPQVTAIEPQKRNKNRFNVFIDGQFSFGITTQLLVSSGLKAGEKISEDDIKRITSEDTKGRLVDDALRFLQIRPRSQKEIVDLLIRKITKRNGVNWEQAKDSPLIENVLVKLKKYKYINDLEFARWWVEARTGSKPRGVRQIRLELLKKGIDKDLIDKVIKKLPNQELLARKALEKKIRKWRDLENIEFKKKVFNYLLSRGFEVSTVKQVIANLSAKS